MDPLSVAASVFQFLQLAAIAMSGLRGLAAEYNTFEDRLERLQSTIEVLKEEENKIRSNVTRATDLGINYEPDAFQTQQRKACLRIQTVSEKVNHELENLRQKRGSFRRRFSRAGDVLWNGVELREMEDELNNFRANLQTYRQGFLELGFPS